MLSPKAETVASETIPCWGIAVVLYQPGRDRLLVVRGGMSDSSQLVASVIRAVRRHPRFAEFANDPVAGGDQDIEKTKLKSLEEILGALLSELRFRNAVRIQVDFIRDEPTPVEFATLSENSLGPDRFEFGVDGFRILGGSQTRYFLPGDAFVKSVLGLSQLRQAVQRLAPGEEFSSLKFFRFRSQSFLRFEDRWIPLYRGTPVLGERVSAEDLFLRARSAIERVVRTQDRSGQFEYYYDAKTDSQVNHEHPTRDPVTNPFYNFVRHCGGILTLLFYEAVTRDGRLAENMPRDAGSLVHRAVVAAIECYLKTLVEYDTASGLRAAYAVDNQKGKLGGSGLGLYSLTLFQHLFGDNRYEAAARKLANHLVAEIQESGEFRYYHTYLDRQVTLDENPQLFSFYYPGEAIIGLAGYLKHVCRSDAERTLITERLQRALRFLIFERPKKYPQHFAPLPSDSWLMMGIDELWDLPEFQRAENLQFVFADADAMCDHQYTPKNSLFSDDIGSFFYHYGDHPYPDGARAEGLTSAYRLAIRVGDAARQRRYFQSLARVAWACLHLCNTRESLYSVPNPHHAYGSIRFKFTRQWVRVDTTEHVASFFLRFLPSFVSEAASRLATCDSRQRE